MMQTREESCLTFELLPQSFFAKQGLLERDGCVETLVDRLVHRTHTALPKLAYDAVATLQNCFGRKHSGDYTRAARSVFIRAKSVMLGA